MENFNGVRTAGKQNLKKRPVRYDPFERRLAHTGVLRAAPGVTEWRTKKDGLVEWRNSRDKCKEFGPSKRGEAEEEQKIKRKNAERVARVYKHTLRI